MRWSRSASLRWTAPVCKKKTTPISEMKGFRHNPRKVIGLLAPYESALKTRPVLTKCATGGVLAFLGDLVAQRVNNVQKGELQFDERRLAAFTVRLTFAILHVSPSRCFSATSRFHSTDT